MKLYISNSKSSVYEKKFIDDLSVKLGRLGLEVSGKDNKDLAEANVFVMVLDARRSSEKQLVDLGFKYGQKILEKRDDILLVGYWTGSGKISISEVIKEKLGFIINDEYKLIDCIKSFMVTTAKMH